MTDPLVSPAWLAERLQQPDLVVPNLVVFDASYFLPAEQRDAGAEFECAHIPRARRFDIDVVADPEGDLPHMAPSAGRFARLMGELGVNNRSLVVFYDSKGLFSAARGWWLMGLFGHDQARVLDGGLPAWQNAGLPVATGPAAPFQAGVFTPDFRASRLRGAGDMRANLQTQAELVLDARSAPRFTAAQPEPRAGLRAGHIPDSQNIPFGELLNADGAMLAPAELRARFAQAGVGPDTKVVTSCGSGVSAAVLTLGLVRAGLAPGGLYDGSWSEWGARADLPVAS